MSDALEPRKVEALERIANALGELANTVVTSEEGNYICVGKINKED